MPHTYRNAWAALILITTLLLLTTGRPAHAAPELAIGDYQLVSSKRISRTEYEYTYSASITNTGRDAQDVIAYLKLDVGGVIILDDKLEFGDVPGGSSVESLDTFTILQSRLYTFTSSDIDWKIHTANLSYSTLPDPNKIIIDPEGAVYPVNQLLILLEDGYTSDDAENIASSVNARVIGAMPLGNIYQLEVPASTSEELNVFIQILRSDQRVQAVVRNNALQLQYATDLAHLRENDPTQTKTIAYDRIFIQNAWEKINNSFSYLQPVTIGIYDSGIAKGHPEFKFDVDVIEGPDKDYGGEVCGGFVSSHGTGVAGIIGANNLSSTVELPSDSDEMNGILSGVSGLNYKLLINPMKLDSGRLLLSVGWFSDKLDAISDLVMRDAKIINMSIGGARCDKLNDDAKRKGCFCITQDEFDDKKDFYISIFSGTGGNSAGIKARSVLFVASAGNDDVDVNFNLPGGIALPNLITVGGTTLEGKRALYTLSRGSNFGFGVDIAAPGEEVYAPAYEKKLFQDDYYYRFFSGTSASAPLVTGVAGLIKAIKPDLTPNQIKNILIDTGTLLPDQQIGPLVNAYAAVCHKDVLNCSSTPTATGKLNDTGITTCSNNSQNGLPCPVSGFPGQDGEHGRDALAAAGLLQKVGGGSAGFDFTKLDANGNPLPASATAWSCVKDNYTGLIWEEKAASGLRSMNHTYTWYNPDSSTNGGDPGVQNGGNCSGSSCDTHGYVQAVNAQGLCGANDWRMPAREELRGIVDYSRINPAIDTAYFPRTLSTWYWSASPYADRVTFVWDVHFGNGDASININPKFYGSHVRLVRNGQ